MALDRLDIQILYLLQAEVSVPLRVLAAPILLTMPSTALRTYCHKVSLTICPKNERNGSGHISIGKSMTVLMKCLQFRNFKVHFALSPTYRRNLPIASILLVTTWVLQVSA